MYPNIPQRIHSLPIRTTIRVQKVLVAAALPLVVALIVYAPMLTAMAKPESGKRNFARAATIEYKFLNTYYVIICDHLFFKGPFLKFVVTRSLVNCLAAE